MMIEIDTAAFRPLSPAELQGLAALGRSDRTLGGLVHAAVRARFLRAAGAAPGGDAEAGLAAVEARACLELAARPALDRREFRIKEAVLRPFCIEGGAAAAMVRAGLASDRRRLALARSPRAVLHSAGRRAREASHPAGPEIARDAAA